MERYNLKSSIEFGYLLKDKTDYEYRHLRDSYDSFLKQPLKLEMFICSVPEPELQGGYAEDGTFVGGYDEKWIEEYYEAKEKVLFEGFENSTIDELKIMFKICKLNIIEDLLNYEEEIQLTATAIKQIGL